MMYQPVDTHLRYQRLINIACKSLDYMDVFYVPAADEDDATQERKDREAALHG